MSAKRLEFYLDMSEVQRNLALLNNKVLPAKIRAGLSAAGNRLMIDTVIGLSSTPIKRGGYGGIWGANKYGATYIKTSLDTRKAGELRASGALFVDGVKMRDTRHYGEFATGKYQPVVYGGTPIPKLTHEACVVFNAPYAAIQHEHFPTKTAKSEGAGMHFMSEKIYGNANTYITLIVEAIRL